MAVRARTEAETGPRLYAVDGLADHVVAEGTDGCLYVVPSEPGGWMQCTGMQCSKYEGQKEELKSIPTQKARSLMWLLYGDMGAVQIAEG